MTRSGRVMRFTLEPHEDVSNKTGRMFARLDGRDQVVAVYPTDGSELACVASKNGRAICFSVDEVNILKAAGKGVLGIKLQGDDEVLAFELATNTIEGPAVSTTRGRDLVVRERKFGVTGRGGKGRIVIKRGGLVNWQREPILMLGDDEESD